MLTVWLLALIGFAPSPAPTDTIRIHVGSPAVDGRVYAPHAARVRVRIGSDTATTAEWTNELALGDSAGRPVMRWVTKGTRHTATGTVTWELRQTYDAITLAPYGYASQSSTGAYSHLTINGGHVVGTQHRANDTTPTSVDFVVERPGFVAGASDLVPTAVGLRAGSVIVAPIWSPSTKASEQRAFAVLGQERLTLEGTAVLAWKVEERRLADHVLLATWYLTDRPPYMVYGEVNLDDGRIQRMTEITIPMTEGRSP